MICPTAKAKYFQAEDWTLQQGNDATDLPVGQITSGPFSRLLNVRPARCRSGKIGAGITPTEAANRVDIPTEAAMLPKISGAAAHRVVEPVQSVQPGRKERLALSKRSLRLVSVAWPSPHTAEY
jgi:hypothetical protein